MSSTFNIHNGVAQTNDMKATLDVGNMAADGTINLVNQESEHARDRGAEQGLQPVGRRHAVSVAT